MAKNEIPFSLFPSPRKESKVLLLLDLLFERNALRESVKKLSVGKTGARAIFSFVRTRTGEEDRYYVGKKVAERRGRKSGASVLYSIVNN